MVTSKGVALVFVIPLIVLMGTLVGGTAAMVRTYMLIQNERFNRTQARLYALSALDIASQFAISAQDIPPDWKTSTLVQRSTLLPVDANGELRLLLINNEWVGIGRYQTAIAVLGRSAITPTAPTRIINPN